MYQKRCIAGVLGAVVLAVPSCALAGAPEHAQDQRTASQATPPAALPAPATVAAECVLTAGAAIADPGQLDRARGGSGVAEATLAGTVGGNTATQVTTGSNLIQSGSFANSTGLPVVIQNSGANVLIQSATVINLELK